MQQDHTLPLELLKKVFIQQLSILYGAKMHVIDALPGFIRQAGFTNLKHALDEDMDDTQKQMNVLRNIFLELGQSAITEACLAMDSIVKEANAHVTFNDNDLYASDMSIIFYMDVIEHIQIGACRVLKLIADKIEFAQYAQSINECLDMNKDNARLFKVVAQEYLGLTD